MPREPRARGPRGAARPPADGASSGSASSPDPAGRPRETPGPEGTTLSADGSEANPSHEPDDAAPLLSNGELARIFYEIGDLVELKGELVYKAVAYRRAADAIAHSPVEVARAYREGKPPRLQGVGTAIDQKIAELARTGRLAFHERLRSEVPPSLLDVLAIPGLGPRSVKELHDALGILTVEDLEQAARAGKLRGLRGMSERTEERILEGVDALRRRSRRLLLGEAEAQVERVATGLRAAPGLVSLTPAGSFRRRLETIGDLDLLAGTTDPGGLVERFTRLPDVERVIAAGTSKGSIELHDGPQVDLMTFPPGEAGTYLVHFTGSKDHNVRLRGIARDRGWSLSEKGFLRLDADGQPATGAAAELRTFPTEGEVYGFLGLPFIEAELREDRGEIEAALANRLPRLVELSDLQGDCHAHSDWSDGVHTPEAMARAARERGYAYLVLTDHSFSLGIARGLTVERVQLQARLIAAINERLAREEDDGIAPGPTHADGFRVLHGCELEIRADGNLDFDDATLARFDLVVAALHQGRRQARDRLTERVLTAVRSPHVHVIAHPAGRLIDDRPDLDLDWETIYAEAARTGTFLEIDGSDHRLDLDDVRARRARDAGCRLTIDSDAHRTDELDAIRWGVSVGRRAWLERADIGNAMSRDELLAWARSKPDRVR